MFFMISCIPDPPIQKVKPPLSLSLSLSLSRYLLPWLDQWGGNRPYTYPECRVIQTSSQGVAEERMGRNGDADATWFLTRSIARSMCTGAVNGHVETRSSRGRTQQLQLRAAFRTRHRLHRELLQQPLMFQLEARMWDLFAPARRHPAAAHLPLPASPSAAVCSSSSNALLQTCPWRATSPAHIQALVLDPEEDPCLLPLLSSTSYLV